ncbi:MAG: copper amine oxidase N-terminal domain-containing protein [Paenibacillus macerans]|uniref:copper amine oxidase N-terminal domain-containing protein n=1 Tax=Paenibacillus macerans TaxID=44252 RepID=UPI00242D48DD|nr:stalk domain-containing protein [Paenibacillus macerans]MBS5909357.1 copper amine oxidase N-terminal domain-containing protein [Paenibacillus macerans]
MNLKRMLITTILAASQMAMVLPASAEELVQGNNPNAGSVSEQSIDQVASIDQNGMNENNAGQVQTEGQTGDLEQTGNGETDGTAVPAEGQDGTNDGNGEVPVTDPATTTTPGSQTTTTAGPGQLILMVNSNKMYQDGKEYLAGYPMEVKDGVSYISIRAIVERAGFELSFDNSTKETIIKRGGDELRFKLDTTYYKVNGVTQTMRGKSYSVKNNFMVPLTAITKALNIAYEYDSVGKRVIVNLAMPPVASFKIGNQEIIAGETQVQYITESSSPSGLDIVNEEWTGRQDVFAEPGSYTVTYRVQDSRGQWSNPFSLTVNVSKPHTPPVASFTTDKDTYKMGELILYTDLSTDEVGITDRKWENKKLAFFTPGPVTIRLTVVNQFGLSSTTEKTINITNELLYPEDEFNKIFVPVGDKFTFDGGQVPSWNKIQYSYTSEPVTLIRSNSPETVYSKGLLYRENAIGATRFMVHHVNSTGTPKNMYVIATNNNAEATHLSQSFLGFGGPSPFATAAGKVSVQRYFESMQNGTKYKDMWLAPGESKIILNELSEKPLKQGDVISLFADLYSDHMLQYNVVMVDQGEDPISALPNLIAPPEDVHNRGTYMESTRIIEVTDLIGTTPSRLAIGDNVSDPFQVGADGITQAYKTNAGNFGMLYKIKLHRVAPNTLVTFNPRGGKYMGVIMVNGSVVQLANGSSLSAPSENGVLFRTEDQEQTVELLFTAAPGSNLPFNILFQQMPATKN